MAQLGLVILLLFKLRRFYSTSGGGLNARSRGSNYKTWVHSSQQLHISRTELNPMQGC